MTNKSEQYRKAYNQGKEIIPDYVYDQMFDSNEAELNDIGKGERIPHLHPMLSLPTHFIDTDNVTSEILAGLGVTTPNLTISRKLDGVPCSCILTSSGWQRAVTRGRRFEGFKASDKLLSILPEPKKLPEAGIEVDIRGEFVIDKADFAALNEQLPEAERYANPRSMVSATINSNEPDERVLAIMQWFAHGIWIGQAASNHFVELGKWLDEASIAPNFCIANDANVAEHIKSIYDDAMHSSIPCDGIVIQHKQTTDNDGRCNLDRIAIKQFDEAKFSGETEVIGINWRLNNNGSYYPRLLLRTVVINGSEVKAAAGYCLDYVRTSGLSIGATVTVTMRGGVIPYISSVHSIGNGDYQFPADAIEPNEDDIQLWSSNNSEAVQRIKFVRGMEMLDLNDCGVSMFNDMYDAGYNTIFDVAIAVKRGILATSLIDKDVLPNTEASHAKIRTIEDRFKTFNYVWCILALRENNIGFGAANAIGQHLSGYELKNPRELSKKAIQAFLANSELVAKVKEYSNPVLPEHANLAVNAMSEHPSNLKKVCMSKKPSNGQKKADFARQYLQGYAITEDIREANMLICPAGENSNKIRYAQAHNIEIKSYEGFINA